MGRTLRISASLVATKTGPIVGLRATSLAQSKGSDSAEGARVPSLPWAGAVLAVGALLLGACTTQLSYDCDKDGATQAQAQQDFSACAFEVNKTPTLLFPSEQRRLVAQCMAGKGYRCVQKP